MFTGTIIHEATRQYVYPLDRYRLELNLKCTDKTQHVFFVHYCNRLHNSGLRTIKMECRRRDGEYCYYCCEIKTDESIKYLRYYFELAGVAGSLYYGADGPSLDGQCRSFEYLYTNECDIFEVPEWAKGALTYQIFPERFCNGDTANDPSGVESWGGTPTRVNFFGGDIKGITSKLDYLSELGIELLYLTPIFKSPSNHKYDTEDYYQVDPALGSMEDLKALVSLCHNRGIKVVLDGVFNHCGYQFGPFQDVLKQGSASKYADWFFIDSFPVQTDPPGYECVGYYKWMPKMRLKNRQVRDYFLDVGTYWIREADIDGWRLDVADEVDFTFWQEFRRVIKDVKPDALLIGETWKDGRDLLRGDQMDSVMNYLFRDVAVSYFAERSIDSRQFDNRIQRMLSIYPDMVYPALYNPIGSHDTPRFATLCGGDAWKMKLAVAFQLTFPGMPALYYGDELAISGQNDPDCRKTMDWQSCDQDMLEFYKKMIAVRKATPELRRGSFQSILCKEGVYGYARRLGCEVAYILINNGDEDRQVRVPLFSCETIKNLVSGELYAPVSIVDREGLFNNDINGYLAEFKMTLPARHFEIIKQGGNKE